ncbi:MAG: hypothetical protein Q9226_005952 [Calogaya cf. arnoldii]
MSAPINTASPEDAVHGLINWAHESLYVDGQAIHYDRLLEVLREVPEAIAAIFHVEDRLWCLEGIQHTSVAHKLATRAVDRIEARRGRYRRNMRHFYEIALPKAHAAWLAGSEDCDEVVLASLCALHNFVGWVEAPAIREQKDVLSDIKRDWRLLGWDEMRLWAPLYEFVTGRELVNE